MHVIFCFQDRWTALDKTHRAGLAFCSFFVTLAILTCGLYQDFIFGDNLLIYAGSGSDSIGQTVPFILNEAARLSSGDISQWNQYQFLGATTIQFLNPDYLPALFGENAVPAMMLASQLMKIILAGVFFYLFLGYFGLRYRTRFVSSLCLALCGRMIELAPWTAYTLEITLFCSMLWGFERFLANRRHVFVLPVSFALIGMSEGVYGFVLYGAIIVFYALFRLIYNWNEEWGSKKLALFALQFTSLLLAGILISLPVILPSLESYSTSARIGSNLSVSDFNFLGLLLPANSTLCCEEIIKFFSNAITGHMTSYTGSTNILNAPYFYAGLLPLLGLPFAFRDKNSHQKAALVLILLFALLYCYSDGFRYLLNGFSVPGSDFRQSSFWVVIVFSLAGALGVDHLWKLCSAKTALLWGTLLILIFSIAAALIWDRISIVYFAVAIVILIVYLMLIIIASRASRPISIVAMALIITIVPIELFAQDFKAINSATHLNYAEYDQQLGSDPEDAVLSASSLPEDTYRIDNKSMMLTRSMADTYLSTTSYIGGAGFTQHVTDFLKTMKNDYVNQLGYTRYSYGFFDLATNSLLGVKYLVYSNDGKEYYIPYGYKEVGRTDDYVVFENTKALPLVYGYAKNECIGESDFTEEKEADSAEMMLEKAIVPDSLAASSSIPTATNKHSEKTNLLGSSSSIVTKGHDASAEIDDHDAGWIEVSMDLSATATTSGNLNIDISLLDSDGNTTEIVPYYTAAGNEHICVQIYDGGDSRFVRITITAANACDDARINNININACADDYFDDYDTAVSERLSNNSVISSYAGGTLTAEIDMQADGFLATSIPWSSSWELYIDGTRANTFPINIGFVGAEITEGQHYIELVYSSSMLYAGIAASAITLIALVIFPRIKRCSCIQAR